MNRELYKEWLKFIGTVDCDNIPMDDIGRCDCKFNENCTDYDIYYQNNKDMKIKTIDDQNTDFNKVELRDDGNIGRLTPHCKAHGAMNKVSKFEDGGGYWRCSASNKEFGNCRAGCIEYKEEL